jgi:predicted O-methyltransferase YrrM
MMRAGIDNAFRTRLERINGWLNLQAAEFTVYLLNSCARGNILEFGIFHGKYLALLYDASAKYKSHVLGVDAFVGSDSIDESIRFVRENIRRACGDNDRLHILYANTMSLQREDVLRVLSEPITFISVDAGHEADNLLNDITLAAELLAPGGIVAVDDAFNHSTPGAIEGTCRYFSEKNLGRLAPFAHCYNKLFLTSASCHAQLLELTKRYVYDNQTVDYCSRTLTRQRENEAIGFVPRFFGYELLPFL